MLRNLSCFLFAFITFTFVFAQVSGTSNTTKTVEELRQIFNREQSFNLTFSGTNPQLLFDQIKNLRDTNFQSDFDYGNYYAAQRAYAKRQLGLNLRADVMNNSQSVFTDIEDNILFQRRYQIGFEWDLLKNGFSQRKTNLQTIDLNEQLTTIQQSNAVPLKSSLPRTACIAFFNQKKIDILEQRQKTLQSYLPLLEKLFYEKQITLEDLYAIQSRLVETKAMLAVYKEYNQNLYPFYEKSLFSFSAPLLEINDSVYFSALNAKTTQDTSQTNNLQRQINASDNKWFNELSLRTYSRLNVFDLYSTTNPYRSFFSLGLNFSMPLPLSHHQKAALDFQKWQKDHQRILLSTNERRLEQTNNSYEYRFGLKKMLMLKEKEKLVREGIRVERTKSQLAESDFNPVHGLKLIDDLTQIQIEEVEVQQILYLKLIDIHEKNAKNLPSDWLINLDQTKFDQKALISRSVYAWSKTFSANPGILMAFVEYNRFGKVFLAVSSEDSLLLAKNEFVRLASTTDVEIIPMVGQNKLLRSTNFTEDLNNLLKPYAGWNCSELHLDLEPHTQEEWKVDEATFFSNYIEKLKLAKSVCETKGWKLSISIPISYDSAQVVECLKIVDEIHFMCYENVKYSYLSRKLAVFKDFNSRIHIALRTEDFKDRFELEQFITLISTTDGFTQFNYHDLNRLIKWDIDQLNNEKR